MIVQTLDTCLQTRAELSGDNEMLRAATSVININDTRATMLRGYARHQHRPWRSRDNSRWKWTWCLSDAYLRPAQPSPARHAALSRLVISLLKLDWWRPLIIRGQQRLCHLLYMRQFALFPGNSSHVLNKQQFYLFIKGHKWTIYAIWFGHHFQLPTLQAETPVSAAWVNVFSLTKLNLSRSAPSSSSSHPFQADSCHTKYSWNFNHNFKLSDQTFQTLCWLKADYDFLLPFISKLK